MNSWPVIAALLIVLSSISAHASEPLLRLRGKAFDGGGNSLFGDFQFGMAGVNYVYARSTGDHAAMTARFSLATVPEGDVVLHILGRDCDKGAVCPIRVSLNETNLFEGANPFAKDVFAWHTLKVPAEALRSGRNLLTIENTAPEGPLGGVPWFMAAQCVLASPDFDPAAPVSIIEDFHVTLPDHKRPMPEPLPEGKQPGFALRGTKGWLWTPEQYMAEIPTLVQCRMNFMMICYGSMFDIENHDFGDPQCNRWWEPLPAEKREKYAALLRACQSAGIDLCLSMNPNLTSTRILDYAREEDFEALWQHYAWFQEQGMQWFSLSLDDIQHGVDPVGQARFVNKLHERLRANDPEAQMIFCPTVYWGRGDENHDLYGSSAAYLAALKEHLAPDIFVFWTGDGVVGRISRGYAEAYRDRVGHRLIIWDNYPVNDAQPALHLGPVVRRDPNLHEVCHGYISNPLHSQNEANRIPLMTCADYAYNPWDYDPARSIGQAILHLAETPDQRACLKDLVELYPGFLIAGGGTGANALTGRFAQLDEIPHGRFVRTLYLEHAKDVAERMRTLFPERFLEARKTLEADVAKMRETLTPPKQ